MSSLARFPFSAVVGLAEARLALLLAAVDPGIGGVLLRGDKGSAKSTLARGLAGMLPGGAPFVELPLGATEDRLLGTLDLKAALADGATQFRPGILAAAHGGVLYVDEVNLLPDHLVDVLLDVAASGINQVERDGVSHAHPARFVLVGSMNPEEGELRPQLLDRFGLSVEIKAPTDPVHRAEIVRRRLDHDAGSSVGGGEGDIVLRARLAVSMPADLPDTVVDFACRLAVGVGAEGLRADLVLCRAAAAFAGWEGRSVATSADVERVAALALGHRRRRRPFDPPTLNPDELERALASARQSFADAYRAAQTPPPAEPTDAVDQPADAVDEPDGDGADRPAADSPWGSAPFGTGSAEGAEAGDGGRGEGRGDEAERTGDWSLGDPVSDEAAGGPTDGETGDESDEAEGGPEGDDRASGDEVGESVDEPDGDEPDDDEDGPGSDAGAGTDDVVDLTPPGDAPAPPAPTGTWAGLAGDAFLAPPPTVPVTDPAPAATPPPASDTDPGGGANATEARYSAFGGAAPGRGRVVGDQAPSGGSMSGVALAATVRAAAQRRQGDPGAAMVTVDDLREPVRTRLVGRTVVVAVDASGSMGTHRRVEAATGAVLRLLADAYLRRDRVAMVTFRGDTAEVVLPPTASVELARTRLAELPTGGVTPLAEGISAGLALARASVADGWPPLFVIITDGRATGSQGALDRAKAVAAEVAAAKVDTVVIDAEDGANGLGLAGQLATIMGAKHLRLEELSPSGVESAVRDALR